MQKNKRLIIKKRAISLAILDFQLACNKRLTNQLNISDVILKGSFQHVYIFSLLQRED